MWYGRKDSRGVGVEVVSIVDLVRKDELFKKSCRERIGAFSNSEMSRVGFKTCEVNTCTHTYTNTPPWISFLLKEEPPPLAFYVQDAEIVTSLEKTLAAQALETERVVDVTYQPQAVFRVRAVTRCTSSLEGHSEAVISVAFSPTGK